MEENFRHNWRYSCKHNPWKWHGYSHKMHSNSNSEWDWLSKTVQHLYSPCCPHCALSDLVNRAIVWSVDSWCQCKRVRLQQKVFSKRCFRSDFIIPTGFRPKRTFVLRFENRIESACFITFGYCCIHLIVVIEPVLKRKFRCPLRERGGRSYWLLSFVSLPVTLFRENLIGSCS